MTFSLAAQTSLVLDPIIPVGAVVILGIAMAALTFGVYRRAGSRLGTWKNGALLLFRLLGVVGVLALLLQPSRLEEIPPVVTDRVTLVAVDDSRSMGQNDVAQGTRSQAAKSILTDAGVIEPGGAVGDAKTRLFGFGEDAVPLPSAALLGAGGATTRTHHSISTMLGALAAHESARALIVLSDGHDFELVNPAKTGFMARQRGVPIYAVALGKQGKVRDASVRITSYQPYCYVKQKARISGALRLIGCELETITVELLRGDKVVQTQRIAGSDQPEVAVNFDVTEPAVGQYEYELRVTPLDGETDRENNHALTYLNVIDQQIQVLFLEGSPYWDTTFLQRSLLRNDKMNVDSIVQYAEGKARVVRKKAGEKELKIPKSAEEWGRYDVIVLGRSVEKLLDADGLKQLEEYVKNRGGTVIFSRGPAFGGALAANELEPVIWSTQPSEHVRLQVAREGQALAPFRAIAGPEGAEALPDMIAGYGVVEKKPLTATLAAVQNAGGGDPTPGMVHRRFGEGQVLSVGVDGLWRWAFNAKVEGVNTLFDRFWDQMILWLMAGRDFLPTQQFSLRASSANVPLGEKIYFRAVKRDAAVKMGDVPLVIAAAGGEVGRTALSADANAPDKYTAEFLPAKAGKYTATAKFPDGTSQSARFIVFDENLEQTEVATDAGYLRKLCESSGGRLLQPEELGKLLAELKGEKTDATPERKLTSAWDRVWVFWLIGALFGADWYLRRRWGLS